MKISRVLIVEDHPLIRLGLTHALATHPRLEKCGEADNEIDAWSLFVSTNPDAVVVDITLNSGNGLDLIKRIVRKKQDVRVVVLSMHDKSIYEQRALSAGAAAYVEKGAGTELFISTLINAITSPIAKQGRGRTRISVALADESASGILTDRELQVFRLIGKGLSTRQIAEAQSRSIKTIESYRARIKKKINASTAEELTRDAVRWVFEHDAA